MNVLQIWAARGKYWGRQLHLHGIGCWVTSEHLGQGKSEQNRMKLAYLTVIGFDKTSFSLSSQFKKHPHEPRCVTHPRMMRTFSQKLIYLVFCFPMPNAGQYVQLSIYLATRGPTKQTGPMSQLLMNCVEIHWSAFRLINSAGILTKRSEDPE